MVDDREPFRTARDAGLKQRHEQRLAHAQAVIPEEALKAAAEAIDATPLSQEHYSRTFAVAALEAALPHLRGRIGYELGRKVALAEVMDRLIAEGGTERAKAIVRDIGKGDPK